MLVMSGLVEYRDNVNYKRSYAASSLMPKQYLPQCVRECVHARVHIHMYPRESVVSISHSNNQIDSLESRLSLSLSLSLSIYIYIYI